jgi:hypothetical protein
LSATGESIDSPGAGVWPAPGCCHQTIARSEIGAAGTSHPTAASTLWKSKIMNARHVLPGGSIRRYNRSARRPGFRPTRRPNWDWVPEQYQWTPDGFDDEYDDWDEPIPHREFRHAPPRRSRSGCSSQQSSFTPSTGMGRRASANHHDYRPNDAYYDDDFNDTQYGAAPFSKSEYSDGQHDDYGHGGHFDVDDYYGDEFGSCEFDDDDFGMNDASEEFDPQDSFYADDYGDDLHDSYQWSKDRPRRRWARIQHRCDYDDVQSPGQYSYAYDRPPMQFQGEDDEYQRSFGRKERSFRMYGERRRRPVRESVDPGRVKRLKTRYAAKEAEVLGMDQGASTTEAVPQPDLFVGPKPQADEKPNGRVQKRSHHRVKKVSKAGVQTKPKRRVPKKRKS